MDPDGNSAAVSIPLAALPHLTSYRIRRPRGAGQLPNVERSRCEKADVLPRLRGRTGSGLPCRGAT